MWQHVPIAHFSSLFEHGVHYANNVAAMPSLHAAYAMLFTLFFWSILPWWTRPLLALYPVAMAFALVYTGEHYVIDVLLGWLYAAVVYVAGNRLADTWAAQRASRRVEQPSTVVRQLDA